MDLNDSGYTFDEIADYLDRVEKTESEVTFGNSSHGWIHNQ